MSNADFLQIQLLKKIFHENYQCQTNILDPDQHRCSVHTDLGPNCLQRLSDGKQENYSTYQIFKLGIEVFLYGEFGIRNCLVQECVEIADHLKYTKTRFIQASMSKIQGLFKDF